MKFVISNNYGGFEVPDEIYEAIGCRSKYSCDRTHPVLVEWVKNHPDNDYDLAVVDIPDGATDWRMDEYDGLESIIAVVNGKIVDLFPIDYDEEIDEDGLETIS